MNKAIKGFPGYKITHDGQVISYRNGKTKIMKPSISSRGYYFIDISANGKSFSKRIPRLVAEAFIDNPLNLPEVNHIDGNKANNHWLNLEWVTHKDNMIHSRDAGLHSRHKLNMNMANEIRYLYKSGDYTHKQLSVMFEVDQANICRIIHNQTWSEVSNAQ